MFKEYPDVLTVAEAARALNICDKSAYRLIRSGSLGVCRVGRKILVPKVSLIDYIKTARYTSTHL